MKVVEARKPREICRLRRVYGKTRIQPYKMIYRLQNTFACILSFGPHNIW